jgi:crotonobetaine/carnitine-CoA ligase
MLDLRASEIPDKVALIWDDRNETYRDLWQAARSAAAGLLGLGLGQGDRFAVYLHNGPEYVHVWLAGLYVGIQPVTINLAYFGDFLRHQLTDSGAKMVVTSADKLEDVLAVIPRCPLVEKVVVLGADRGQPGWARKLGVPVLPFSELRCTALSQDSSLVGPDDPGAVIYTSGTTGPSKGVRLSQGTLAYVAGAHCSIMGLRQDDVALIAMPLFHVSGLNGVSNTLLAGCTTVFERRFSAGTVLRRMLDHGVTATTVAGPILKMMWSQPRSADESELRLRLIYAGSALPASFPELQDRYGIDYLCTAYGQTEVQASIAGRMPGLPAGSAGKPLPAFETRLVDEAGDDVPPGAAGELLVRPRVPHAVFSGYLNDPSPETTFSADGWYQSGDVLRRDLDGFFYLVDRKKDVVRRRGENISSVEVEDAIGRHPAVADVAVHAVPADLGEDEVKAVVVAAESAKLSPEELHQFCVSCLPRFAVPRYIEFVDALPRNPLGRVQKFTLRERGVTAATWDRESADGSPAGHMPGSQPAS